MISKTGKIKKYKIKKGDTVYVIAGKEKGKTGKILRVIPEKDKVIVENLNVVKKHRRPTPQNPTGGIVEVEAGIHISNVMLYDTKNKRPVKVGCKITESGKKVRIDKKTGEEV